MGSPSRLTDSATANDDERHMQKVEGKKHTTTYNIILAFLHLRRLPLRLCLSLSHSHGPCGPCSSNSLPFYLQGMTLYSRKKKGRGTDSRFLMCKVPQCPGRGITCRDENVLRRKICIAKYSWLVVLVKDLPLATKGTPLHKRFFPLWWQLWSDEFVSFSSYVVIDILFIHGWKRQKMQTPPHWHTMQSKESCCMMCWKCCQFNLNCKFRWCVFPRPLHFWV